MTTAGDIIVGGVSGVPTRLAKGADGEFLGIVSGVLDWITVSGGGGSGGGGIPAITDKIYDVLTADNGTLIDEKIEHNDYVVLIHLRGNNSGGWTSPSAAQHTVAVGKKLIVLGTWGTSGIIGDSGSRKARLYNVTDSADVVSDSFFTTPYGPLNIPYTGDVSNPTALYEVAAGKTVSLDLWNTDSTKRAMGGIVICREIVTSGWIPNPQSDPIDYVTTNNGARIPGLAANADIQYTPTTFSGILEEYESNVSGITWNSAPAVEDSNTTIKSHLYAQLLANTSTFGTRSTSIGTAAFDMRTKIGIGNSLAGVTYFGLIADNTAHNKRWMVNLKLDAADATIESYYYDGSFHIVSNTSIGFTNCVYLRMKGDGSNGAQFYVSTDGIGWVYLGTTTSPSSMSVDEVGYYLQTLSSSPEVYFYSDWLRTSI